MGEVVERGVDAHPARSPSGRAWLRRGWWVLLITLSTCAVAPSRSPQTLTIDEVEARLGDPHTFVYDANPREMYDVKHVPGATWVAWNGVTAADLPADKDAALIFYCAIEACSASRESAATAIGLGYRDVSVMPQGILGWKKAGKPVETSVE